MLKTTIRSLMMATMLVSTGLAAAAADYTLRATANSNENDEDYDGLVVFKNYVEAASNGAIAVELFIGTQLCANGAECLQSVSDGTVDIYISTSGGAAGIFPYVQVLDLPYLMASDRIAEEVLSGDFTRKMRAMALCDTAIRYGRPENPYGCG
jgi:TRAP-type C4-dicarboxylate transport system substrate-binding protein